MVFAAVEPVARPLGPAHRPLHRAFGLLLGRRKRRAFVERHDDVGTEQPLHLHRPLGRQHVRRPVEVRLEANAFFRFFGEFAEAHHLIAAAVGQDRPVPIHELVQPAERRHPLRAGPEHQMIGIAKQDIRAARPHPLGLHRLDRRRCPDRHECRCADHPALHRDCARARAAIGGGDCEGKAGHVGAPPSGSDTARLGGRA